jgi:hypothetical protein
MNKTNDELIAEAWVAREQVQKAQERIHELQAQLRAEKKSLKYWMVEMTTRSAAAKAQAGRSE